MMVALALLALFIVVQFFRRWYADEPWSQRQPGERCTLDYDYVATRRKRWAAIAPTKVRGGK